MRAILTKHFFSSPSGEQPHFQAPNCALRAPSRPKASSKLSALSAANPALIPDVVFITCSTPRQPNDELLLEPLRAAGLDVSMAGDCIRPGELMTATAQGPTPGAACESPCPPPLKGAASPA